MPRRDKHTFPRLARSTLNELQQNQHEKETPVLKVPTVVWCCGTTVSIGMFWSNLLAQPGSNYGSIEVPGTTE